MHQGVDPAYSFTVPLSVEMCGSCTTRRYTTIPSFTFMPFSQCIGTFIGVGVGVGMFLLLVLLTSVVVLILVVVVVAVVRRKRANKRKRHRMKGNNVQYNNTVVVMKEMEKKEKGVGPSFESIHIYDTVDGYQYEENEEGSPMPFPLYEAVERTEHGRIPAPKKPFIPARAEDGCTAMNIHEYDLPMRRRSAAYTQKRKMKMEGNLYYNNTMMVEQEMAMKENSSVVDCKSADGYQELGNDKGEYDANNDQYAKPMKKKKRGVWKKLFS